MTRNQAPLSPGDEVIHQRFGPGVIEFPKGTTAIVRFEHGLEECDAQVLKKLVGLESALSSNDWHPIREVVSKCQAAAIQSVNDSWGVFSRSRISLLPHQLWVCHRVSHRWPVRYLVADDVGLGKTIEAGLILWPLLSKGLVRRLLVLCPASLVEQWQYRLREMFDIRLSRYSTELDSNKGDFWNTHHQVVASLPTLRSDRNGRHERMLDAEPWDLLIVDEAHHLNADESSGSTLGYKFVEDLLEKKKVESCVFFSGTPHRGKAYGFWSLMKLLRPDLFDPKQPDHKQIAALKGVMIRNNKSLVMNMKGEKLFKPVSVRSETYRYKPEEEYFYKLLTEFIAGGKAYASSLSAKEGKQVMLVLIAMQKLASSSVAAIRKALQGRLGRLIKTRTELQEAIRLSAIEKRALSAAEDSSSLLADQEGDLDLMLVEATLTLMEEEIPNLESLVQAAYQVESETKIEKILDVLEGPYKERQVLFFTEYKATQSLLMNALMTQYGEDSVTFINGDEGLQDLLLPDVSLVTRRIRREDAADLFNSGKVRFLISTEAGGEGIDLQHRCHSLIHVDLPWNPMRLHQRVGRLNRYGQKHPVEVITLRNPETVESRIWDLLNAKLERITSALSVAMDDPEDLLQLVLGMSSTNILTEVFSDAALQKDVRLDKWFDEKTETIGGKSVIDAVQSIVGNADKFDLSGLKEVPNVDLPHLQPFFEAMLVASRRRVARVDNGLTFKTPEEWLDEPGIRRKYDEMVFDRNVPTGSADKVLGVGHKVFDRALKMAAEYPVSLAGSKSIEHSLIIFQVMDSITDQSGHIRRSVIGAECFKSGKCEVIRDWKVLEQLNGIELVDADTAELSIVNETARSQLRLATSCVDDWVKTANLPFRVPTYRAIAAIISV